MKLWRKMGNKVKVEQADGKQVALTGRQFKERQNMLTIRNSVPSDLLEKLTSKLKYVSPYAKDAK